MRWEGFAAAAPDLEATARARLYRFGLGLAYLATIRPDGGPRIHPVCPAVTGGGLYLEIGRSPKYHDLVRDGRVAVHSFPDPDVDDECLIYARAVEVDDETIHATVRAAQDAVGVHGDDLAGVFELDIERVLLSTYGPRPSWPPVYTVWRASP
jgi:hypothetical protein